jgi:uncharacterized SAM-binding protein YcdF (DUF218 family)
MPKNRLIADPASQICTTPCWHTEEFCRTRVTSVTVYGERKVFLGMHRLRLLLLVTLMALLAFSMTSGSFLIVNNPQKADVILVLAGEFEHRPLRGLELLSAGYAARMLLDVPAGAKIYGQSTLDIARSFVQRLPQKEAVSICPIHGLSTKTEAHDAAECLKQAGANSVLVVTSDYHTRRALSIFRHEVPRCSFSVAAANDPVQFGPSWWNHRQWAKLNFDEWIRVVWWYSVDRWR